MSDEKVVFKTRPIRIEEPTYQKMLEMSESKGIPIKTLISQMFDEWHHAASLQDNEVMDEVKSLAEQMLNIRRRLQVIVNGRMIKSETAEKVVDPSPVGLEKYFG